MPSRGLIPVGVFEGSPCIQLSEADWDPFDPEKLVRACLEANGPGIDLIQIHASLPWGSAELDHALALALSQPALSDKRLWRQCVYDDNRGSVLRAHVVLDASYVLNQVNVREELHALGQWPDEVVILSPDLHTVKFEALDDILGWTQAHRGYIYIPAWVDPNVLLPDLTRCSTCWAVRKY